MTSALIHPVERVRGYLRTLRVLQGQTRDEVHAARLEHSARLEQLNVQLAQVSARLSQVEAHHTQLVEILRHIRHGERWHRARLRELRTEETYERAYADPDPLVSVVIPTYDNHVLLKERAIPSVLEQTYQNFEVIVVGDAASEEARIAVESFGEPRITFFNRLYRGPYPSDPRTRWLVAGVPPYNEAVHRARGLWIAPLDDDDAFRPHHLERVLTRAREDRLELCYSRLCGHSPGGRTYTLCRFPPEHEAFGLQSAIYHAGLAPIFELELADAAFGLPYDWGVCLRMMEADVRIGMVDEETVDYYPSRRWTPRWAESLAEPDDAPPEWEYVPEGFARASHAGEQAAVGWRAEGVARAYREKWPEFLEAVAGADPLGVSHETRLGARIDRHDAIAQSSVLVLSFALARAANGSRPLSVLDWGGALGHFYVLARRLFPELKLDYHCRELPLVCAQGREVLPEVTFHDTDECLTRTYDLVIASNSLQYEEDWQQLLRRLAGATGDWALITNVPVVRRCSSYVVLQRAHAYGYATEYLGWVLNQDELLRDACDAGLELEREFILRSELGVEGAPEAFTHAGFLFRRNGGPR